MIVRDRNTFPFSGSSLQFPIPKSDSLVNFVFEKQIIQNSGHLILNKIESTKTGLQQKLKLTDDIKGLQTNSVHKKEILNLNTVNLKSLIIKSNEKEEISLQGTVEKSINLTKSALAAPNLTPYQPKGWDDKLVVSTTTGTHTSASVIYDTDNLYVDWSIINNGTANVTTLFYTRLYIDGTLKTTFNTANLNYGTFTSYSDYSIGKLSAGTHTLRLVTDATGIIAESDEKDNEYSITVTVVNKNLTPYQPSGWDSKIVVSTGTGTHTSGSTFFTIHTLYVDWAVTNNGTAAITETFHTKLYVDGVLSGTWYTEGLAVGAWANISDFNIGNLTAGSHSIKIETDVNGVVTETSESDNAYTRYITVYPYVNLTTYLPTGWDSRIVLSTVTGTNTSDSQILSTDNIYLDWSIANVSSSNTTTTFYIDLYIDGVWKSAWTRAGLNANTFTTQLDYLVGKLSPGTHTFLIRIDRDGYVPEYNETDNEYLRTITVYNKNVLPYQRSGWDNKLVLSTETGTTATAPAFYNNQDIYVDWSVWNNGSAAITETFHSRLYVDGVQKGYWYTNGLAANYTALIEDYNIGKLTIGNHTFQIVTDCDAEVAESNETDNSYSRTIYVGPSYNLLPYQPGEYDNKLVLSTVTGTGTSASVFYDTDNIYVDWACLNNGLNDFTTTFYIRLYIDGVFKAAWTRGGLEHNTYTWYKDHNVGKLTEGTHTFRIVMDSDDDVAESDEADNEYSRTITVVNKNLLPYQPIGWDNKIVLSTVTGTNTSAGNICDTQPIYLDYAILNNGSAPITETFYVRLYIDGVAKATWTRAGVGANTYYTIQDYSLGTLTAGVHTFKITADVLDNVDETSEADNEYSRTFTVSTCKNLTPHQPSGWDDEIVLSTASGTHTSATTIYNNQNVYLDWSVINNGANNITETFSVKLYVDAVLKASFSNAGLPAGVYLYYSDFVIGTLTAGEHIFKIVADSESNVAETSEADNEYSRTFTVSLVAPVATAATSITQTGFNANWNAAMGATNYYLDVSTNNTFSSFVTGYNNKDVGNVLTSSVTGLTSGTTYYYRLRAYNTGGTSPNSNIITVITIPASPVATAATGITQTGFSANWNASSGANGYYLDIATDNAFSNFVDGYKYKDVGNVLTLPVSGLTAGTSYYYRLKAYNNGGTSTNSNTITVITIPPAPVAIAATAISQTGFNANWNAATGATGYRLDVSTSNTFASYVTGYKDKDVGNALTSSVTGLTEGTTYYYRLRANNSGGTSPNSNIITVITIPPAPVATAATSITQTSFSANWNASGGATGYYLDVSTNDSFSSFVTGYNNKDVGNVLTSTVTGLIAGTTYYYRLRAYSSGGTSPNSNVITVTSVPAAPVATAASTIALVVFNANWNASTGATGYYLDVSTNNSFSSFVTGYNNKDVGNVITATVTGLSAGITYYYRIRAYNLSGTSGSSNVITVSTIPPAPVAIAASSISQTGFNANWNTATGATAYYLDVATDNTFTSFVAGYNDKNVGNVLTSTVIGLSAGSTYHYRVRAGNTGGTGPNSNVIAVSTVPPAPVATAATEITQTSFSANWNASAGATGYYLDVATNNTFSDFIPGYNNSDVGNVLTLTVTGLTPGTSYTYRVRAYNTGGTSDNSNVIETVTTELCAQHFHPVWEGTAGFNHMNINVIEAKHEGFDLEAGDEIGVFDGSLCVGYGKVTETIDHDHTLSITVSQNDGSGNGFTPGHEVLYIFWDCSSETEFNVQHVACFTNELNPVLCSAFTSGATTFVSLSDLVDETQQISLNTGWNIMSMRVLPAISNLKEIFQSLIDEGKLKKVMDESGKTIEDWGIFGGWKNNIGDLQLTEGYKINVTDNALFEVQGVPVRLPFEIALIAGWNIISWPSPNDQEGIEVFNALIADGKLKKVMDESGKTIEDWGIFGGWKNNIGNLKPGEGYNVNVNSDCILIVNESGTKSEVVLPEILASTHFIPAYKGNGKDHMNINLVNLTESGIMNGDEIGVFDGNVCVGSAKINLQQMLTENQNSISIPVSAFDETGGENGFIEGNSVLLKIFRNGVESSMTLKPFNRINTDFEKGESLFAMADIETKAGGSIGSVSPDIIVYPNPFSNELNIKVFIPDKEKIEINIYDVLGRNVKELYHGINPGKFTLTWDGKNDLGQNVITGVYTLRINEYKVKIIRK